MMSRKAVLQDDLVTAIVTGDGDGEPIPRELAGVPADRLRWDGARLVDAADYQEFYVDGGGRKRLLPGVDRHPVTCAFTDALVRDEAGWRVPSPAERLAPSVKAECGRRINAVLKDLPTQANITSAMVDLVDRRAAGLSLSADQEADVAMARALKEWVSEMRETCRAIILLADATYADDAHWPAAPAGARAFADRF